MGRDRTRTYRRQPCRHHHPVSLACGRQWAEGRSLETAAKPDQTEPTRLHSLRPPGRRAYGKACQGLFGLHHGGHRRHSRRSFRRDARQGKGRPALVPDLQDAVGAGHTRHRADGRRSDGKELPRGLADGQRLLRPAHRHRHRPPVQERHPHVRDLPRSRRALPARR